MDRTTYQTIYQTVHLKQPRWVQDRQWLILISLASLLLLLATRGQTPLLAQGPPTVIVDTTDNTVDGNTGSVPSLLNNRGDDGRISFLEALTAVNRSGPGHTINFDLPHGATIALDFTESLTAGNTLIDGDIDGDGRPDIVLDGPNGIHVLAIESANNTIRNLVVTTLSLDGAAAHDNRIEKCYIGADVSGTVSRNQGGNGIEIENGAHHNIIENNIIAGTTDADPDSSGAGILFVSGAHDNQVRGNWIGVGVDGTALPNEVGIFLSQGAWQNEIGGNRAGPCIHPCNVISGNLDSGLVIRDAGTVSNTVLGNYVGLAPNGVDAMANGHSGVALANRATWNRVGGARAGAACTGPCNLIGGNQQAGVLMHDAGTSHNQVVGNYIGLLPNGTAALPNGDVGVSIQTGAGQNQVGGLRSGAVCNGPCNLISGNAQGGVRLHGSGTLSNVVAGNYIGLNATGAAALRNLYAGVQIGEGAGQNLIGGARSGAACDGPCNVISGNRDSGLLIWGEGTHANRVQGNYIGANAGATAAMPNGQHGIHVTSEVIVLPTTAAAQAAASDPWPARDPLRMQTAPTPALLPALTGYQAPQPAHVDTTDALLRSEETLPAGQMSSQMFDAMQTPLQAAPSPGRMDTQIGGTLPGAGNLIAGNALAGIELEGEETQGTRILGNQIGTDSAGNDAGLGNSVVGIQIFKARASRIGGPEAEDGNLIAYNGAHGIYLAFSTTLSNTIRHNSIHHNGGLGIYIVAGAQGNSKPPALLATTTRASGTDAPPNATIDLYIADQPRAAGSGPAGADGPNDGHGEGMTWVASGMADANGHFDFALSGVNQNDLLTATSTDSAGNTSQFSYQPELIGLEVTQAIQDLHNSVLLVEEKPAFVRAHVGAVPGGFGVAGTAVLGELVGRRAGGELAGSPLAIQNQGGSIELKTRPHRFELDDSFLFELPAAWSKGNLEVEFRNLAVRCAEPANLRDNAEAPGLANDCRTSLNFGASAAPEVMLVRLAWQDSNGVQHAPDFTDMGHVIEELEATMPVPHLAWQIYPAIVPAPALLGDHAPTSNLDFVGWTLLLHMLRTMDFCLDGCTRFYIGIFDDMPLVDSLVAGQAVNPLFERLQGAVAAAYLDGDRTVAHEFGHLANRSHTECVGDERRTDGDYPYAGGLITGALLGPDAFHGFDIRSDRPTYPWDNAYQSRGRIRTGWATSDLMSYCSGKWPSDWTYRHIHDYLQARFGPAAATLAVPPARIQASHTDMPHTDALLVSGLITPTYGAGALGSVYGLDAPALTLPEPGPYQVRFERAPGELLASHSFALAAPAEGDVGAIRPFALLLPRPATATRMLLLYQEQLLDLRTLSATAPTVSVLAPNGGETLSGPTTTLRWAAADADGDPLRYAVQMSADGGATWRTLAVDWPATTYELDMSWLPGTDQARLRVLASDGWQTAQDTSDAPFTVANHAPQVRIQAPAADRLYVGEQMVLLRVSGYDGEDGLLADAALTWQSDLDGSLGTGQRLELLASSLAAGAHRISVTAQDSVGATSVATIAIQVAATRPRVPAALSLLPDALILRAQVDDTALLSQTLSVRNAGDGDLAWTAAGDQPWVTLMPRDGAGLGEIAVQVDPTGLSMGEHNATITVTGTGETLDAPTAEQVLATQVSLRIVAPNVGLGRAPTPNSHNALPETSITLRYAQPLDPASVGPVTLRAHGMQTGHLPGIYAVEGAETTLIPVGLFQAGEVVQVVATDGLRTMPAAAQNGAPAGPLVWQFRVATAATGAGYFVDSRERIHAPDVTLYGNLVLGDLDGDGDLDGVQSGSPTDKVWLNQGRGLLADSGQTLHTHGGNGLALGDLDGDGDLDVFVLYYGNDNQIWRNDGAGLFSGPTLLPGHELNQAVALGDLDGDGDLDAFLGNQGPNTVWFNDGAGGFTDSGQALLAYSFSDESTSTHKVVLGDLDGDGDLDAYAANALYDAGDRQTQGWPDAIWLNDGAGAFSLKGGSGGYEINDVALGDLDGDGKLDIFTAGPLLQIFYSASNSSRILRRPEDSETIAQGRALALGDLDGDGDLDALIQTTTGGELWLNDGQGRFPALRTVDPQFAGGFVLGDLDRDRDLDALLVPPRGPLQLWRNGLNGENSGPDQDQKIYLPLVGG